MKRPQTRSLLLATAVLGLTLTGGWHGLGWSQGAPSASTPTTSSSTTPAPTPEATPTPVIVNQADAIFLQVPTNNARVVCVGGVGRDGYAVAVDCVVVPAEATPLPAATN